jgi:NAD-dependent SIR2 family protein deacetylase
MTSVTTVACASCGAQTPAGKKFCINCGSPVRATCPSCGEPSERETTGGAGTLDAAVGEVKPAQLIPLLDAEASRARGRLAAHRGELEAGEQHLRRAIALFGELETPFYLARAQLEYAELLIRMGREAGEAGELRDEAAATFEALGASPWLARARSLQTAVAA